MIPNEFVKELNAAKTGLTVGQYEASTGRRYFHDQKSEMTVSYTSRSHHDTESRLKDMDDFGIDVQAVSPPSRA